MRLLLVKDQNRFDLFTLRDAQIDTTLAREVI